MGGAEAAEAMPGERAGRDRHREDRTCDARLERMDRVAVLYGEITAATRAFLAALAECDRHRDWEEVGFGSCAEWLAWRLGITRNTANEKMRAARALEELPKTSAAMARGELSFSKVRALTRAATPDNEEELLRFAHASSAAKLERLVRGWKKLGDEDEQKAERVRHRSREFSVFSDNEGMYVVKGRLPAEVGALLMRAVAAASDALFTETGHDQANPEERPEPRQLRADALGLVAERAMAEGFGGGEPSGESGDREANDATAGPAISGTRAERYQVMLHVEAETLAKDAESGQSELQDGTRVTAETARRLSCDCAVVELEHRPAEGEGSGDPNSSLGPVLNVRDKRRSIPPSTRRALETRDRGCRFPGCGLRFTHGHHIEHWSDGGPTRLDNLVLLCPRHHRRVHEGGYQVAMDRNHQLVFFTLDGDALFEAPELPELEGDDPVKTLIRRNRERGVDEPHPLATAPDYPTDHQVPWRVEAAARETLERGAEERADAGRIRVATGSATR